MKLDSLKRRIDAMKPALIDPHGQQENKLLMQAFELHFLEHLRELGCSEVIEEVKAALPTLGPQPFGHTRPDDRSVSVALNSVKNAHHDLVFRIRAADLLALADAYIDLGEPEDDEIVKRCREAAARDLEWEKKDRQTFCDKCGGDLRSWSCNSGNMQKLCKACGGGCGLTPAR
jgi:hypothetical protein